MNSSRRCDTAIISILAMGIYGKKYIFHIIKTNTRNWTYINTFKLPERNK